MKHSISRQMTVIFVGLMSVVLAANLLINNVFLDKYYLMKMQRTLVEAYRMVDEHIREDGVDETYFTTSFQDICNSIFRITNIKLIWNASCRKKCHTVSCKCFIF